MNTLRNNVKLIGHLGQDPEIKTLEKGSKVVNFSIATNSVFTDKEGNRREQTDWHNIIAYGGLAETCEKYLKKGKEVAVDGRLTYRNWEDKNGMKHTSAEVFATEVLFLGSKPEKQN